MTRPWEKDRKRLKRLPNLASSAERPKPRAFPVPHAVFGDIPVEPMRDSLVDQDQIQLLYFKSRTCPPCQVFKVRLLTWLGKVRQFHRLREVDCDSVEGSALADHFSIRSIPTIVAATYNEARKDARTELARVQGAVGERELDRLWTNAVSKLVKLGEGK
jgi:thiol-disulfide isomerase/thioredoxin